MLRLGSSRVAAGWRLDDKDRTGARRGGPPPRAPPRPPRVAAGWRLDDKDRTGARRGAPPPAPPRSFLAERGEFDRAATCIALRPRGTPLSRPLPPELQGGEENFDPASEGVE